MHQTRATLAHRTVVRRAAVVAVEHVGGSLQRGLGRNHAAALGCGEADGRRARVVAIEHVGGSLQRSLGWDYATALGCGKASAGHSPYGAYTIAIALFSCRAARGGRRVRDRNARRGCLGDLPLLFTA